MPSSCNLRTGTQMPPYWRKQGTCLPNSSTSARKKSEAFPPQRHTSLRLFPSFLMIVQKVRRTAARQREKLPTQCYTRNTDKPREGHKPDFPYIIVILSFKLTAIWFKKQGTFSDIEVSLQPWTPNGWLHQFTVCFTRIIQRHCILTNSRIDGDAVGGLSATGMWFD